MKEIPAKSLLQRMECPEKWFGVEYNLNLFRGCEHGCIYCDSRSDCYQIARFGEVGVKADAINLLHHELAKKRRRALIGFGAMSDPYTPAEAQAKVTREALKLIAQYRFPLKITTKSDLILRDLDILNEIKRVNLTVAFSFSTIDDELAAWIEPGAPSPSRRLTALRTFSEKGIFTGVLLMPVLPFLEDQPEQLYKIVKSVTDAGTGFLFPGLGVTLRDGQREYFYEKLGKRFPNLVEKYRRSFGGNYSCAIPEAAAIHSEIERLCQERGVLTRMPQIVEKICGKKPVQLTIPGF